MKHLWNVFEFSCQNKQNWTFKNRSIFWRQNSNSIRHWLLVTFGDKTNDTFDFLRQNDQLWTFKQLVNFGAKNSKSIFLRLKETVQITYSILARKFKYVLAKSSKPIPKRFKFLARKFKYQIFETSRKNISFGAKIQIFKIFKTSSKNSN